MRNMKQVWDSLSQEEKQSIPRRLPGKLAPRNRGASNSLAGMEIVAFHPENPKVESPCCGRNRSLDEVIDLGSMDPALRLDRLTRAGIKNPAALALCSACAERLRRTGVMEWSELAEALQAPNSLIQRHKDVEARRKAKKRAA